MDPLRYLDREEIGALRTRLRWRWKAYFSRRLFESEGTAISGWMLVYASLLALLGVDLMALGILLPPLFGPSTALEAVGAFVLAIIPAVIGSKIFTMGLLELTYLYHAGWGPSTQTDRVTVMVAIEALVIVMLFVAIGGIVGGIAGATAGLVGYDGWLHRMWPSFALIGCFGLAVYVALVGIGMRLFGYRFFGLEDVEDRLGGIDYGR